LAADSHVHRHRNLKSGLGQRKQVACAQAAGHIDRVNETKIHAAFGVVEAAGDICLPQQRSRGAGPLHLVSQLHTAELPANPNFYPRHGGHGPFVAGDDHADLYDVSATHGHPRNDGDSVQRSGRGYPPDINGQPWP
jgi:hypothetical protein